MNLFKAVGFKLISALLFAAMSALVRLLGDVAPVGQMVFFRSAFAILPVVMIYAARGELMSAVRTSRPLGQLGRGMLSVCGMFSNFSSLTRLPLADATAISFASPLITVALAAIILKEKVRVYRWTAVFVGFAGVMVMLIPNLDVGQYVAAGVATTAAVGSLFAITSADAERDDLVDRLLLLAGLCARGRADLAFRLVYADRGGACRAHLARHPRRHRAHLPD
jgi:drug/metabolite transporter (DMT)-like permease